jgi:hypothetical protein
MNDKRQNNQKEQRSIYDPQLRLAFAPGVAGEAQDAAGGRVESSFSPHEYQSPTNPLTVMQEVLEPIHHRQTQAQGQPIQKRGGPPEGSQVPLLQLHQR